MQHQREQLPDLLRGMAVLAMIQVHVTALLLTPAAPAWLTTLSLLVGGAPAAPLFLLLMGYYAWDRSGWRQARRGALLCFGALALNAGLNASLLLRWWRGEVAVNPWHYLLGVDILLLAGLSLLLLAPLPRRPGLWLYAVVATLALQAWLAPLLTNVDGVWRYVAAVVGADTGWSYFPLLPWLAYPLAGGLLRSVGAAHWHRLSTGWRGPLWLAFAAALPWATAVSIELPRYYHHGPAFFTWALLAAAALALAARHWLLSGAVPRTRNWLSWLGRHVTAVYVIQWLLLGNVASWWYRQAPAWSWPLLVAAAVWLAHAALRIWLRLRRTPLQYAPALN